MAIIAEVDVYTASVVVPAPGDEVTAASVTVAFQALANRTLYLSNHYVNGEGGGPYPGDIIFDGTLTIAYIIGGSAEFSGGIIAGTAQIDTCLIQTALLVQGSIEGETIGFDNASAAWRAMPLYNGHSRTDPAEGWKVSFASGGFWINSVLNSSVFVELDPAIVPHGSTLFKVQATVEGQGHGGSMPENNPVLKFYRSGVGGTKTLVQSVTDPSGSVLVYDNVHVITIDVTDEDGVGLGMAIDREQERYFVEIVSEWGATYAQTGMIFSALRANRRIDTLNT